MVVEKVFAVIAESTRRDILEALAQESKAVGQLVDELGVSQPTVSKHLRVLREAGVVTMRAQGQKRFYAINTEPLALVSTWLETLGAGPTDGVDVSAPVRKEEAAKVPVVSVPASSPSSAARPVTTTAATPVARQVEEPAPKATSVKPAQSEPQPVATVPAASALTVPGVPVTVAQKTPGKQNMAPVTQAAVTIPETGTENDGGVQRQLSRSVGRAAKKGADLLATFKRRKD